MTAPDNQLKTIGIFLFDDMEELDAIGPWEVFAWWVNHYPEDGWTATTFSLDGEVITCEKSLRVLPHTSATEVGPLDVLLHPGGDGCYRLMDDGAHIAWLQGQAQTVPLVASVCTGSLVLAKAGLLAGRPATSNHGALDELAALDATIRVDRDERFVDDGAVITSAGISAGIDMALHIVSRLVGSQRTEDVCAGIEYNPGGR